MAEAAEEAGGLPSLWECEGSLWWLCADGASERGYRSKGDGAEGLEGGGVVSTDEEEDRGLSLSATNDEEPRGGPLEDTVGSGLLSPSLSRSRSRSLLKLRVRSSIGPLLPPSALLWPLMWETGVLLRGLKAGPTGDILTGCRPYSILSLSFSSLIWGMSLLSVSFPRSLSSLLSAPLAQLGPAGNPDGPPCRRFQGS